LVPKRDEEEEEKQVSVKNSAIAIFASRALLPLRALVLPPPPLVVVVLRRVVIVQS